MPSTCKGCQEDVPDRDVYYIASSDNTYCQPCMASTLQSTADPNAVVVACSLPGLSDYAASYDAAMAVFGVTTMTYKAGQKLQKDKDASLSGKQLEHMNPNSCYMMNAGRTGLVVHGAGDYAEGDALVFAIDDDQRAGTEHKMLTDIERNFAKTLHGNDQFATSVQWLQVMAPAWERMFVQHRRDVYAANKQVTGTDGELRAIEPAEIDDHIQADAREATRAMAHKMQERLDAMNVDRQARLKNGLARGASAPPKRVSKKQRFEY